MKVYDVLSRGRDIVREAREGEILLAHLLKLSREALFTHPEREVKPGVAELFFSVCKQRTEGVPIAYLTGHREFFGLDFYVDERALIPRPETELVVEEALKRLAGVTAPFVCDVGTGSGCIAISIAKRLPTVRLLAVDISKDALAVAQKNAEAHAVLDRVHFAQSDLLTVMHGDVPCVEALDFKNHPFDAIVANLPYIGRGEYHLVSREVQDHEPHEALFAGETGLELFERMFEQIAALRHMPRFLIAEAGFLQKEKLNQLIHMHFGGKQVEWKNDLAGLPRVFIITF